MPNENRQDAALAISDRAEGAAARHDPAACEKVPYTAYYATGTWYWQIRCPHCGKRRSQNLKIDGHTKMLCDGLQISGAQTTIL